MQHTQRSSQAQTSIQTHTVKLIVHTTSGFFFLEGGLRQSPPFHSFTFTSIPALWLSLSLFTASPHPLFFTTGHYELLALTPGNYGNSFSLDYRRTVAVESPVGRLHHHNQTHACTHVRAREGAHVHSMKPPSSLLPSLT